MCPLQCLVMAPAPAENLVLVDSVNTVFLDSYQKRVQNITNNVIFVFAIKRLFLISNEFSLNVKSITVLRTYRKRGVFNICIMKTRKVL